KPSQRRPRSQAGRAWSMRSSRGSDWRSGKNRGTHQERTAVARNDNAQPAWKALAGLNARTTKQASTDKFADSPSRRRPKGPAARTEDHRRPQRGRMASRQQGVAQQEQGDEYRRVSLPHAEAEQDQPRHPADDHEVLPRDGDDVDDARADVLRPVLVGHRRA